MDALRGLTALLVGCALLQAVAELLLPRAYAGMAGLLLRGIVLSLLCTGVLEVMGYILA